MMPLVLFEVDWALTCPHRPGMRERGRGCFLAYSGVATATPVGYFLKQTHLAWPGFAGSFSLA